MTEAQETVYYERKRRISERSAAEAVQKAKDIREKVNGGRDFFGKVYPGGGPPGGL
jgi:hypothetical protein